MVSTAKRYYDSKCSAVYVRADQLKAVGSLAVGLGKITEHYFRGMRSGRYAVLNDRA